MATLHRTDVVVVGAGLAGLVTTLELLGHGRKVLLVDRCKPEELGGLAREALGGVFMVGSREQRLSGIRDSVELALADWMRAAKFDEDDEWPRRWAREYVARTTDEVGNWLKGLGVRFFPIVNWAERGSNGDGNSVPRFHLTWGCGPALVDAVWSAIQRHPQYAHLDMRLRTRVTELLTDGAAVKGCRVVSEEHGIRYDVESEHVVIAAGGIGGNLDIVRREWPRERLGEPPKEILMGSHYHADGAMHEEVTRLGGNVTHISRMWNYADAVRHPMPRRPLHGLKLIPPRSGVVLDPSGRRYGPQALISQFDAKTALERMCEDERGYYWMIANWKIAARELDVSGSEHNPYLRDKRLVRFVLSILLGKPTLVKHFVDNCPDFVTARSLPELGERMKAVTGDGALDVDSMIDEITRYDAMIARGKPLFNDDQLRRIAQLRNWRGDRFRTCNFARIVDEKAMPLIAIRMTVLSRKSLGGIQTDLASRVLRPDGNAIDGLYAVGEAAGFGGGGIHGAASLEGTFLGACVFTGRLAAQAIARNVKSPALTAAVRQTA